MKSVEAMIHDAIQKTMPKSSQAEKATCEQALNAIFKQGQLPKNAFGISSEMVKYIYGEAYRLFNSGNYDHALALFAYLCLVDGTDPAQPLALAACYHRQKNYIEAIKVYRLSFYLDPTNPLPLFYISDCYVNLNDYVRAIKSLDIVLEQANDNPVFSNIKERASLTKEALNQKLREQMEKQPTSR